MVGGAWFFRCFNLLLCIRALCSTAAAKQSESLQCLKASLLPAVKKCRCARTMTATVCLGNLRLLAP